jgi:hypothetical protein
MCGWFGRFRVASATSSGVRVASVALYRSPIRRSILVLLVLVLLLAACSPRASDPVGSTIPAPGSTTSLVTTTSTTPEITTTVAQTTTTIAEEPDVVLEGGTDEIPEIVVHGPDVFEHSVGEEIEITVLSSVEDEIHVHGYDHRFPALPSEVTVIEFTADVLGIFEVELEASHVRLFVIEVTP